MFWKRTVTRSQEYAEGIVNTIREPLIILDQDLRVVTVSRSFYEVFQVKPEETVGQLMYNLGNRQWDIPKLRELLETILPQKTTFDHYEVEHDFATIGKRIMLLNARQIERVLGKKRIILLAIEDITKRREIEKGLEKARKELEVTKTSEDAAREFAESLINTVREPLLALDQNLRVVKASRSFYDFFKVKPEETIGQPIYDLGNKQWDIPKLRELLETIVPQQATFDNYEVEHKFATIGRRTMLLNARQIERALGKERIILLAIEDITEKKKLEEGVRRARDVAEVANKELEAFSYSVSHDLRAPLRSIDGFSRIVIEEYAAKLDVEGNRLLNIIRSNAQKMGDLITDLLNLSRVTRNEMKLSCVDMSALVKSVYTELAPTDIQKKCTFSLDPLPETCCDFALMRQVWRNLISNAIKYTAPRDVRKIEIGGSTKDGMNEYVIKDSGVGFDPRYVHKLFGVFQRLHKAEEFEGTGVGLALVQRIVRRHGGRVWAEGQVGQGATFHFSLPTQEKACEH